MAILFYSRQVASSPIAKLKLSLKLVNNYSSSSTTYSSSTVYLVPHPTMSTNIADPRATHACA